MSFKTHPLENLRFVEDGMARFIGVQNGNTLEIKGRLDMKNSGAELILAGIDPTLANEVIEINMIPDIGLTRSTNRVSPQNENSLFDWYSQGGNGELVSDVCFVDLDNGQIETLNDIVNGNSYSITLKWKNLIAMYYLNFSENYSNNISDI